MQHLGRGLDQLNVVLNKASLYKGALSDMKQVTKHGYHRRCSLDYRVQLSRSGYVSLAAQNGLVKSRMDVVALYKQLRYRS
jgi:hypothetical protein